MVRLKAIDKLGNTKLDQNFNSSMVRLKDFRFVVAFYYIVISIPQWCDKDLEKCCNMCNSFIFQFLNGAIKRKAY